MLYSSDASLRRPSTALICACESCLQHPVRYPLCLTEKPAASPMQGHGWRPAHRLACREALRGMLREEEAGGNFAGTRQVAERVRCSLLLRQAGCF